MKHLFKFRNDFSVRSVVSGENFDVASQIIDCPNNNEQYLN